MIICLTYQETMLSVRPSFIVHANLKTMYNIDAGTTSLFILRIVNIGAAEVKIFSTCKWGQVEKYYFSGMVCGF